MVEMKIVEKIDENSTDSEIPTAAAIYRFVTGKEPTPEATEEPTKPEKRPLSEMSWSEIAEISAAGLAKEYFEVGEWKAIGLNGKIGAESFDGATVYAVIVGIDHSKDECGITWGIFADKDGSQPLVDSSYGGRSWRGKTFNMNHNSGSLQYRLEGNYGGWAACDMRYDILGSTNVPPKGYGSAPTATRVGYDPVDYNIVDAPVADTLLAALPIELRAVMKPMKKRSFDSNDTIDYLPLISSVEAGAGWYDAGDGYPYTFFEESPLDEPVLEELGAAPQNQKIFWTRSVNVPAAVQYKAFRTMNPKGYKTASYCLGIVPLFLV